MDANTTTLFVGLAGIASTLVSSGLGLYFIARARRSPMRELLYARQLDLIMRVTRLAGRIRVFVVVLAGDDPEFHGQAREDLRRAIRRLSILADDAATVLPAELFAEVKRVSDVSVDIAVKFDESKKVSAIVLVGQMAKMALLARALLGVDKLSDENTSLFATEEDYKRLSKVSSARLSSKRKPSA